MAGDQDIARLVVQQVIERGLPKDVLLNVNVPYLPVEAIQGMRLTRQGLRVYRDLLVSREDPRGLATALVCMGRAYELLGEPGRARPPLEEALALARRWGFAPLAEEAAAALGESVLR